MNGQSGLVDKLMTAGMLLVFIVVLGAGSVATAAKSPAGFTVNQMIAPVEQTSPPTRLAQFTNPPGKMLGGAGLFGPSDIINPPGGSGGIYFVPDPERGVPMAPSPVRSIYRRCPYGGFDCDL